MSRFQLVLMVTTYVSLAALPTAAACSLANCYGGHLLPTDGVIPPNAPALIWVAREGGGSEPRTNEDVSLVLVSGESPEPVSFTLQAQDGINLIVPDGPLAPGARFEIAADAFCDYEGNTSGEPTVASFETAGEDYGLPSSLGTLNACAHSIGSLMVAASASCRTEITAAQIPISIELSEDAAPWVDLLVYSTTVDGEPWNPQHSLGSNYAPGSTWEGRAKDRVFTACNDYDRLHGGLAAGPHTVQMHATLLGTDIMLSTNEVEVTLTCDGEALEQPLSCGDDRDGRMGSDSETEPGCHIRKTPKSMSLLVALGALGVLVRGKRRATT